jgi:hypothetical protein
MRRCWIQLMGVLLGWMSLTVCPSSASAREVVVEELLISLYNKPVTGFRMILDRSERLVANQIREYVEISDPTRPFQYERSIIYENIRYRPVSADHDLSLYFMLKNIQGQFTELTAVVMYDYRRSISTREFPEMALRLKIDLAKLVRKTSGDVARFDDLVFDDVTLAKLEANPYTPDLPVQLPTSGNFKREEVERGGVYLPQNPFKRENVPLSGAGSITNDTAVQRLAARIQQLEAQTEEIRNTERNLRNEHAGLQRQYDILLAKVKAIKRLQDSVALLNQRMESLVNQSYVADDISVSNETATEMDELEQENEQLKRQNTSLEAEADSLRAIVRKHNVQLTHLAADSKAAVEQIAQAGDENKKLIDSLNEEVRAAVRNADAASAELARQKKETEALQAASYSSSPSHFSATDSVKSLMLQLRAAERQAFEASATKDALEIAHAGLLTKDQELRKTYADLSSRSTELSEAQMARSTLQKSLAEAQWKLEENARARTAMQLEIDRYKQQNQSLQADLAAKDALGRKLSAENGTLNDSVSKVLLQKSVLEREFQAIETSLLKQIRTSDSLHSQLLTTAMLRENELMRSISTLKGRVDSLAHMRVPESQQASFLKEQRSILDQREKDMSVRELTAKDKEKLLAQREYALLKRESEAADQEARFRNLEDRERRIQLLEQQLNAREGISPADLNSVVQVKEGYIVESGERIPVFVVESSMGYKTVQRQIVGYMLSRDELFDDRFPELLYRAASLAELDSEAVEMKVRIESSGSGSRLQISFLLTGGEYLGENQRQAGNSAAKQLIIKMLRYKF